MSDFWLSEAECTHLLGKERGKRFMEIFGGTSLFIPKRANKNHTIAEAIDVIGMATLCREYGGYVVRMATIRPRRNCKDIIMKLLGEGYSLNQVASMVGVTDRWVSQVKKEYKEKALPPWQNPPRGDAIQQGHLNAI